MKVTADFVKARVGSVLATHFRVTPDNFRLIWFVLFGTQRWRGYRQSFCCNCQTLFGRSDPIGQLHEVFLHPNQDVAVISFEKRDGFQNLVTNDFVIPIHGHPRQLNSPEYFFAGYPLGRPPQSAFSVVSKVAGIHEDHIYLANPSVQGYSGGPCVDLEVVYGNGSLFHKNAAEKKFGVIGIVTATQGDNTGGKMALVIPIAYVFEAFQHPRNLII